MLPLVWITDPWNTLSHSNDTTLRLMKECIRLNVPTYWSSSDFILNTQSLTSVKLCLWDGKSDSPSTPLEVDSSKIHRYHYRPDPPVDLRYLSNLKNLEDRVGKDRILNPPDLLRQSEKLLPESLKDLSPLGFVIQDVESMKRAKLGLEGHILSDPRLVVKPMNAAQSIGVELFMGSSSESEWISYFSTKTHNWTVPVLVQEYLANIEKGETRLWFSNGKFIAALKKYPISGDFRVQIDRGSKVEAYSLSPTEQNIAEMVGKTLHHQKAALAAIDLIGEKISDYNITSPGLLVQLEEVHGMNFSERIINELLIM